MKKLIGFLTYHFRMIFWSKEKRDAFVAQVMYESYKNKDHGSLENL